MGARSDSGQGSLEYLLLISGAILIGVVVFSLAVNTVKEGGNILSINLGAFPTFQGGVPEKSLAGDPIILTFTVDPAASGCEALIQYEAIDNDTDAAGLFVRVAVSPDVVAINELTLDDFDSSIPIPGVEFQTFLGALPYTPSVCGKNYYLLRVCDSGMHCVLSETVYADTP